MSQYVAVSYRSLSTGESRMLSLNPSEAEGEAIFDGGASSCPIVDATDCSLRLDRWKSIFNKFDPDGSGYISMTAFRRILNEYGLRDLIGPHKANVILLTANENLNGYISYQDFTNIVSDKRTLSFTLAMRGQTSKSPFVHADPSFDSSPERFVKRAEVTFEQAYLPTTPNKNGWYKTFLQLVANEFIVNEGDKKCYIEDYSCISPPFFILLLTLTQIGFFTYFVITSNYMDLVNGPQVPMAGSPFIYNPSKKLELWRFFSYIFLHSGIEHIVFNSVVQVLVGVPLEMVHGTKRVGAIYFAGILAGSMGTSIFDMNVYLVGASGGTYALLVGHITNLMLNIFHLSTGVGLYRIILVFIVASGDVGVAIWRRYDTISGGEETQSPPLPISFVAHFMGIITGLTMGLLVFRNVGKKLQESVAMWISMAIYFSLITFTIFWNVFYRPGQDEDAVNGANPVQTKAMSPTDSVLALSIGLPTVVKNDDLF